MDVRHGEDLGRAVHDDGHAPLLRGLAQGLRAERPLVGVRPGEDVDERRPRPESRLQLLRRRDLDDLHSHGADRRVVDVARVLRDDALVLRETAQVGDADVQVGVPTGDAGQGRVRDGRGASRGHHPPLGLRQLRQALADRLGQLVEVDVVTRRRVHRGARLGQHRRAGEDRVRAPRVDEGPHPDRLVDLGADPQAGHHGRRDGRGGGAEGLGRSHATPEKRGQGQEAPPADQLAASDPGNAHGDASLRGRTRPSVSPAAPERAPAETGARGIPRKPRRRPRRRPSPGKPRKALETPGSGQARPECPPSLPLATGVAQAAAGGSGRSIRWRCT